MDAKSIQWENNNLLKTSSQKVGFLHAKNEAGPLQYHIEN